MISIIVPHFKILYRVIVSTHVLDFRRFLRTVFQEIINLDRPKKF